VALEKAPAVAWPAEGAVREGLVRLVVRPESLRFVDEATAGALEGLVATRRFAGPWSYFGISLGAADAGKAAAEGVAAELEVLAKSDAAAIGQRVRVALDPAAAPALAFPAEGGAAP
jgi:hypothetical protein